MDRTLAVHLSLKELDLIMDALSYRETQLALCGEGVDEMREIDDLQARLQYTAKGCV